MLIKVNATGRAEERLALRSMFEARKRVFVDLLGWELPVLAGRYELDRFDDARATYLIIADGDRRHLGSARLLETERPHILDTLFPDLVAGPIPCGRQVREITSGVLTLRHRPCRWCRREPKPGATLGQSTL